MKLIFNFFNLILNKVLVFIVISSIFILILIPNLCDSKRCHDIDVRNNVNNFDRLINCTIVTGYLQVVLLERAVESDYQDLRFDSLREISGFLIIHRAFGLKSLGQLFPNLVVIRGIRLFVEKYAFVIYDNEDIEEIGLKSLIHIQRGFVRIQKNPQLCFSDTILWQNITKVDEANVIDPVNATKCPSTLSCRGCEPSACWSVKNCQRFDTPYNRTGGIICHPNCLGGCYDTTDKGCIVCRNITRDDGRCVEKCELPRILNVDNDHCLYPSTCLKRGRIIFDNRCVAECPPGYILQNVYDDISKYMTKTCIRCKSNCTITCNGTEIHSLDNARKLQGCTLINGTLLIRINIDVPNVDFLHDLELYLGQIEEITHYLKVYRSTALTTLSFLKNLRKIDGKLLESGKYALIIYDNPNLKTLWNWKQKLQFQILNGSMSIHYNNKLCMAEIYKFQNITTYSNENDFVVRETNGNKQSCNVVHMFGEVVEVFSHKATVAWEEFISKDPDYNIVGYLVAYIETPRNDITPQYGKDVCSKFSWTTILLTVDTLSKYQSLYQYTITNLKPYTHYGIYIKSFSAEDENLDIIDGQTLIRYFTTLSAPPRIPIVGTASKTSTSLQIRWVIDENEHDLIEYFKISVLYRTDDIDLLDERDYCLDSQINETESISSLELLPCCMKEDEEVSYDELIEIGMFYQTGSPPTCFDTPTAECHHLPYAPNKYPQSDSYYNYNNYYHNIDYEFRDIMFQYVGLNNLRSTVEYSRIIRNYTLKNVHRDYNITNLRPFGMYTFVVIACNKRNQCSPFYMHTDRTAPLRTNDDIEFDLKQTPDTIYLYFPPPPNPNGAIIAYHIEGLIIGDEPQEGTLCVTRKKHEESNFTYTFYNLPNGSYAIRVRSLSLAGPGTFSDWKQFVIYENISDTTLLHMFIFLFIVISLIIILVLLYKYFPMRYCCKKAAIDRVDLISMEYKPSDDEVTWHLNYDSDGSEFSGFTGFNRSSSVEDPIPGPSNPLNASPTIAHTEHERF